MIYQRIKRGIDFVLALLAMIILLPVFLFFAVAIKAETRGAVFF